MINSLKKYLYISLGLHLFIVIVLLIISSAGSIKQQFIVFGAYSKKDYHTLYKAKNSIIPFMGHRSAISGTEKHGNGKMRSGKKKSGKSARSSSSKNKKQKKSVKNSNKSTTDKSGSKKKQPLAEPSDSKSKKTKKKQKEEQRKALEEEKKIEAELKKIELEAQKEIDQEIKKEEKREAEKQKELEKKEKEAEKKEREAQEIKPAQQDPEITADPEIDDGSDDSEDVDEDEAQDGAPREEYIFTLGEGNMSEYGRHIKAEIERLWKPPSWVPKGTTCRMKFIISKDGEIEGFQTIQKSNVIIYDLSILRDIPRFKFVFQSNKRLRGNSVIIDFCQ